VQAQDLVHVVSAFKLNGVASTAGAVPSALTRPAATAPKKTTVRPQPAPVRVAAAKRGTTAKPASLPKPAPAPAKPAAAAAEDEWETF